MTRKLSEMTLEELWQLFPIILTEPNAKWDEWYNEEYQKLCVLFTGMKARISHIGSTTIKTIWAKPIIDILMEIPLENDRDKVKALLVQNGYICMAENNKNISFNKSNANFSSSRTLNFLVSIFGKI